MITRVAHRNRHPRMTVGDIHLKLTGFDGGSSVSFKEYCP